MSAREQILSGIRRGLGRGELADDVKATLDLRLKRRQPHLLPERAKGDAAAKRQRFVDMATAVAATVAKVKSMDDVPDAVAGYLAGENLPAGFVMAPNPELESVPWSKRPTLTIKTHWTEGQDMVSVTGAVAGIAETGTLMLASGPTGPTLLNFLPETHVVIMKASQVVGGYEEAWRKLEADRGGVPRTVNFITGPSRTGDIEQKIQMGAHGPRKLHIVLVED
jgi:L-lactate dehydrogenase complex protein LldG